MARGRNALARYGLASVVASPTLYLHGLSPLLAGMLILGPELLWFTLGLGPWSVGPWITMALVGLALFRVRGSDLRTPNDLSRERADLHPVGRLGQVWPGVADGPIVHLAATRGTLSGAGSAEDAIRTAG